MTPETEAMLGPELVEFVSKLDQGPDIIFSELDFDRSYFGNLQEVTIVDDLFEDVDLDNWLATSFIFAELNGSSQPLALSVNKLFDTAEGATKIVFGSGLENPDLDLVLIMSPDALFDLHVFGDLDASFFEAAFNKQDLMAFALFHEIGHNQDSQSGTRDPVDEMDADLYAARLYRQAFESGIVNDPDLPEKYFQYRAIRMVLGKENTKLYPFNSQLSVELIDDNKLLNDLMADGPETIYVRIIELFEPIERMGELPEVTVYDQRAAMKVMKDALIEAGVSEKVLDRIEGFDIESSDPARLTNLIQEVEIPNHLLKQYKNIQNANVAVRFTLEQPELVYSRITESLTQGEYDSSPFVNQLAENFVLGAETFAPNYFDAHAGLYQRYLEVNAPVVNDLFVSPIPSNPPAP